VGLISRCTSGWSFRCYYFGIYWYYNPHSFYSNKHTTQTHF